MQPQDPMFDFYRMLMERNQVNIPEAFMKGQTHAMGMAEGKSRLATDQLRQRELQLQTDFLPEQQGMQRTQFGREGQLFNNQMETFGQQKELWPTQKRSAELDAKMKEFEASHQQSNWDFSRSMALAERSLKNEEIKIRRSMLAIQGARNDTERAKASQNYVKQFNDYSKNAGAYAALAAKYRGMATELTKGDRYGEMSPQRQAQAAYLLNLADGYAKMAQVYNTNVAKLFPDLAPPSSAYTQPNPNGLSIPSFDPQSYEEEEDY